MRFPWQRRADIEHGHRLMADRWLREAEADWPKVRKHAEALRAEKDLNGWTATIVAVFGTPREPKGHHG